MVFWPFSARKMGARPDEPGAATMRRGVDSGVSEILDELRAVDVVADHANELHRIAEARRGNGLVGAFAAGSGGETGADYGLADAGDLRRAGHHIHGDAADNDDWFASFTHGTSIERGQGDGAESHDKENKHEDEQQVRGTWCAGELAPDEDSPAGRDHGGSLADGVGDGRPELARCAPEATKLATAPTHQMAPPRMPADANRMGARQ